MRPRLPLCLLPFVGVLAFASSFNSNAANLIIQNGYEKGVLETSAYYAFDFNALSSAQRQQYGIGQNNTLTDRNNTFTFKVNYFGVAGADGLLHIHPGSVTDLEFDNAIVLYGSTDPLNQFNGKNLLLNNTSLTFNSAWGSQYPICKLDGLVGEREPLPGQWTYLSKMGIETLNDKSSGDVTFDFQQDFNEFFVMRGEGSNTGEALYCDAMVLRNTLTGEIRRTQVLKADPLLNLVQGSPSIANFKVRGNVNVLGGTFIYADKNGEFITGKQGSSASEQSAFTVSGNKSIVSLQEASTAVIYSNINVTNHALFYHGVTTPDLLKSEIHGSITLSEFGAFRLATESTSITGDINVINGGQMSIHANNFIIGGNVHVSGTATSNAPDALKKSVFNVSSESSDGIFNGTVTVENKGALELYGQNTIFNKGINVGNNGGLILGGEGDNTIIVKGGLNLGNYAQVEVNTRGTTSITDGNGQKIGLNFQQNGYFSVFQTPDVQITPILDPNGNPVLDAEGNPTFRYTYIYDRPVYDGGFSVQGGYTVTIRTSVSTGSIIANRGDYVLGTLTGEKITGAGNIDLLMYQNKQSMVLNARNTFTGTTTITRGILVLTNETLDVNGNIVSSSVGAGKSALIFSNDTTYTSASVNPILSLRADYNGTEVDDPKTLNKNIQIGSTWGNGYGVFVTGAYSVVDAAGTGYETQTFASNVILGGDITDYGDSKSRYNFIKEGTGTLTFAGKGAGQGAQVRYNGQTIVRQGSLILGNKDGVSSLVNEKSNAPTDNSIVFDGRNAIASLTINPLYTSQMNGDREIRTAQSFNNNIVVVTQGRIDLRGWSNDDFFQGQNITLSGDIYGSSTFYSEGRLLEIYSTSDVAKPGNGVVLTGNIGLNDGTLKYFGHQLTLQGWVDSSTTLNLSGTGADGYTAANLVYNPKENNTLFDATLAGAKDFIKDGANNLYIGSDMSDGVAYTGDFRIQEGTVTMYKDAGKDPERDGKLSEKGTLYLDQTKDANGNVLKTGTLDLANTEQTVAKLVGNGILQTTVGILNVTNGHGTGDNDYFGGNVKGNGILVFNKQGADATFRLGNFANNTADSTAKNIDFSGIYAVKGGGILSLEEKDILSHKATMALFDNSTLNLRSDAGAQTINALYSLKDDYKTDLESQASIRLGDQASLNVKMGLYSGSIVQENNMDPYATAIQKLGATDGDGEPLAVGAKENTFVLVGNGNANQYNFNGRIAVGQLLDTGSAIAGGTLVLDGTNLSKAGPVLVTGNAKELKYDGGPVKSQVIVDLTNHDVTLKEITLQRGAGLRTTGGASGNAFNVQNMYLEGASLIVEAALDANHKASLQGFNVNGEVTISRTEKNFIDLDLAAGNWGYNAETNSGTGNSMKVFTTSQDSNLQNLLVKESKYVFLDQNREIVNNKEIYIDVTRNGVKFSDFINGSIGASLDHADSEYVSTNKLKGQNAGTLGLVLDQMYVMTSKAQVAKAVHSLSGVSNYALPTAQLIDLRQHVDTVRDRISRIGVIPGTNMTEEVYHGWAMGLVNSADIKADGQVPGFKKDTWGGMVGFDTDVSNDLSWGMAFAYTSTDIDIDGGDSAKTEAYYLDGFGRYQKDKWSVVGVATVGTTTSDAKRRLTIGDVDGIAKGSPNGYFVNALAEVGYDIDLPNNWIIQPLANLNLGYLNVDSYSETGMGNAGLNVDSTGQFIARLGAGVRSVYSFYEDAWSQKANLQLRAMILQDLADVSPSVSQSLIGSVGSFDADGSGMGKTAFQIGAGVSVPVAFNLAVFANVDAEFRSDANSIGGNLGVRYTF